MSNNYMQQTLGDFFKSSNYSNFPKYIDQSTFPKNTNQNNFPKYLNKDNQHSSKNMINMHEESNRNKKIKTSKGLLNKSKSNPSLNSQQCCNESETFLKQLPNKQNPQSKMNILKSELHTKHDMKNQVNLQFGANNNNFAIPLPTRPLTKNSPFRLPQLQSHSQHQQNNPDKQNIKNKINTSKKSKEELHTLERTWSKNLACCTKRTLDDARKIGILEQELRLLNLHRVSNIEMENLGKSFDFMKKEAIHISKTIAHWLTDDNESANIFKEIDMDNNKKLSISEIHNQTMRNQIKLKSQNKIMQFRVIIKLGINKINPHSKGYVTIKEFIQLFRYIKLWSRMQMCFNEIDINEDGSLQLSEFIDQCRLLGFNNKESIEQLFKNLDFDQSNTVSLYEFCQAFTGFMLENELI